MGYAVACTCGKVLPVSEELAGSSIFCQCGRTVSVPPLDELQTQAAPGAGSIVVPEVRPLDGPPAAPDRRVEAVLAPTPVRLRTGGGASPARRVPAMVALTGTALWIQETYRLREVPLATVAGIEARRNGRELVLTLGPDPAAERLGLAFPTASEGERWRRELEARRQQPDPAGPPTGPPHPEGVALVRRPPDVPHTVLGRVAFDDQTLWAADRGVQLRAGMRGADAVFGVVRSRCPDRGPGARSVSGVAVRLEDAADRPRLRLRWFAEEINALTGRMALLLVLQAALLYVGAVFLTGFGLEPPTGESLSQKAASGGLGLGLLFAWPFLTLALLRVLRWPQLLRVAGLAVLAVSTGRGLTVWLAHVLAVASTGTPPADGKLWILLDPADWAFVIIGAVLCVRAWRLAGAAADILPPEARAFAPVRKAWGRGLLALTGAYALALLVFAGTSRYQASAQLLQPGVDPRREQEALRALNEGAALANRGELSAAEQSFQQSLRRWEELTARPSAPPAYRANLAITLNDLAWVRERQGRREEAEKDYARAVAVGDGLAGSAYRDDHFERAMAGARAALAGLRGDKESKALEDKDRTAARKYEEAQVRSAKAPPEAERLYAEAIALWEEILPQATNEDYRKDTVARLATAYLVLGELRQQLGDRARAEEALTKGIEYGEKAVAQDPDRPLPRHNLETARRMLEGLRDQAHLDEVNRLCAAQRFAEAADLCRRGLAELEEQARSGKDREAATQRLASRLDGFAWFLAHCPNEEVRDTKAAVRHASRATQLRPDVDDYWYTLATVQYRNGDWRDSLASLERLRSRKGGLDASAWLVTAMDRHRLGQKEEARFALRQARDWMREQERKAEDDALLRLQYELARPGIDALKREAESLIEGADPGGKTTG